MSITEYLYMDERRINAYAEQIGSVIEYDKLPTWGVELGLTGPRAKATQQKVAREATLYERIKAITEYLRASGALSESRTRYCSHVYERTGGPEFFAERCSGRRVFIPMSSDIAMDVKGIALWHCPALESDQSENMELFLIENFPGSDNERAIPIGCGYSGFSLLMFLFYELRQRYLCSELHRIVLENVLPPEALPDHPESKIALADEEFLEDPLKWFKLSNSRVGPVRHLSVLYRLRLRGRNAFFGYPLFVAEDSVS